MLDNNYFNYEDKEEVFGTCSHCGEELGIGHEVVIFENEIFCDDVCLLDFLKENREYTKKDLEEGDL